MKKVYGCWLLFYNCFRDKVTWHLIKYETKKSDALDWRKAVTSPLYGYHKDQVRIEVYAKIGEIKPKKGKK